ncbi:hypothetical protein ACL9RF_13735 [Sphingobacterium sp. Mn56C]|uniref:hypothetical protein n=1 Tax=Sphingobacterium sp. Mn56C TaxID=3395261 RepID=UPI003BB9E480
MFNLATVKKWLYLISLMLFFVANTNAANNDFLGVRAEVAAKGGGSAFRYMTEAELMAVQNTGLLRGGRAGETFFTKDLYKSAASAQQRLALPSAPTLRVEFQILNNPTLLRNGTKVQSAFGMSGRGAEFMTLDPVKVRLINSQPLR